MPAGSLLGNTFLDVLPIVVCTEKQQNLLMQLKEALPKHKYPKQIKFISKFFETYSGKVKRLAISC